MIRNSLDSRKWGIEKKEKHSARHTSTRRVVRIIIIICVHSVLYCTSHRISHHEEHVSRAVDVSDHLPHISSSGVSLCEDKVQASESEQTFGGYNMDCIQWEGRVCVCVV